MKNISKSAGLVAAIVTLACAGAANANSISGSVGGAPTGVNYLNLDDLPLNDTPGSFTSTGPSGTVGVVLTADAQAVQGSVSGLYAAPYLSGSNGNGFGNPVAGPDTTTFLTSGKDGDGTTGSITLNFGSGQKYFGLLWGSIDTYNTISFYSGLNGTGSLVQSYTGTDADSVADGDQSADGTLYVNIDLDNPYMSVVITSSQYAFELDNVAYNQTVPSVPDGGLTIALLGFALVSVEGLRRKFAA
jgi:hypothetical protein